MKRIGRTLPIPFQSPSWQLLISYVILIFVSATVYWCEGGIKFNEEKWPPEWSDYLYFSVVTITTLGYGDAYPTQPFSILMAGLEALLGVILMGVYLVTVGFNLANKKHENDLRQKKEEHDLQMAPYYASATRIVSESTHIRDGNEMAPENVAGGTMYTYRFANGEDVSFRATVDFDPVKYSTLVLRNNDPAEIVESHVHRLESLAKELYRLVMTSPVEDASLRLAMSNQVPILESAALRIRNLHIADKEKTPAVDRLSEEYTRAMKSARALLIELTGKSELVRDSSIDSYKQPAAPF